MVAETVFPSLLSVNRLVSRRVSAPQCQLATGVIFLLRKSGASVLLIIHTRLSCESAAVHGGHLPLSLISSTVKCGEEPSGRADAMNPIGSSCAPALGGIFYQSTVGLFVSIPSPITERFILRLKASCPQN